MLETVLLLAQLIENEANREWNLLLLELFYLLFRASPLVLPTKQVSAIMVETAGAQAMQHLGLAIIRGNATGWVR